MLSSYNHIKITYILILLVIASGCAKEDRIYKETRGAMYTVTTITLISKDKETAKRVVDEAFTHIQRLEKLLNYYDPDSEISKINKNAGITPVKVSKETFELIDMSIKASEMTDGGFDITAGPLIKLWDFKNQKIPNSSDIKRALGLVDYKSIALNRDENSVFIKKKDMEINLGGIIKGYAAEIISNTLKSKGINGGIVAIGGDIKTFGIKPDGRGWTIGIQHPRPKKSKDELIGSIELSDKCISTSGDYERFFEADGVRYHHIIDTKTGYPSKGMMSITVVTDNATMCDALSTGLFTMGVERALKTMKKYRIEGLIIDDKGQHHATELFLQRMLKE